MSNQPDEILTIVGGDACLKAGQGKFYRFAASANFTAFDEYRTWFFRCNGQRESIAGRIVKPLTGDDEGMK